MIRCTSLLLALFLLLPSAKAQVGAGIEVKDTLIGKLEQQRAELGQSTKKLAKTFYQGNAAIASLKKQRASWNRDRKLKSLLSQSKQIAVSLDARQKRLRDLNRQLAKQRQALITLIDNELRATPSPTDAKRWQSLRSAHLRKLPSQRRKLKLTSVTIDPLDDPEDLDEKASILHKNERELTREQGRLIARADYYTRRAKLDSSQRRNDALDIFREDQPRRSTGRGTDNRDGPAAVVNDGPAIPPDNQEDPGGFSDPTRDSEATPSVLYADVIFPGTLSEFRRAERSGDPSELARAARRAASDLNARVDTIKKQRQEIERRAKWLRRPSK